MMPEEFSLSVRVYIEDTDAGGIVYYVNYLKFMERARTEYMRGLGFDREDVFDTTHIFVVRDVAISYQHPARLDDLLQVTVTLTGKGAAYLDMRQTVMRGEVQLAEATVKIVCVDPSSMAPRRLPAALQQRLTSDVA